MTIGIFSSIHRSLKSFPNDKILYVIKFKSFADDKINVAQMMVSVLVGVENIVGKGENAGYQHFLLFLTMFSKGFFLGVGKSQDYVVSHGLSWMN